MEGDDIRLVGEQISLLLHCQNFSSYSEQQRGHAGLPFEPVPFGSQRSAGDLWGNP